MTRRAAKFGLNAVNRPRMDVEKSDSVMIVLRPNPSANAAAISKENANMPVEIDNVTLAAAAEMPNSSANTGISGCVVYNVANVTKPLINKAMLAC